MKLLFNEQKKAALNKDKSNIGSIDEPILKTINLINSSKNYYTTSSCSGRIILIKISQNGKKNEAEFLFRTHSKTSLKELKQYLKPLKEEIWLRQEPLIIHVCSKSLEDALKLLNTARLCSFKKSGIMSYSKRIILEINGIEQISTIVSKDNKILVDDDYLNVLIQEANQNLERIMIKIERFNKLLIK
ncbi:MAG: tRNA wybutosine-synthesizing 3 family protein [archaeon]